MDGLTQSRVVEMLHRLGRTEVTERTLVDWRAERLLPPLTKEKNPNGRGWVYLWTDPQVIRQANMIAELLDWYASFDGIRLPLFCLGFPVELNGEKGIRGALIKWVHGYEAKHAEGLSDPEDVAHAMHMAFLEDFERSPSFRWLFHRDPGEAKPVEQMMRSLNSDQPGYQPSDKQLGHWFAKQTLNVLARSYVDHPVDMDAALEAAGGAEFLDFGETTVAYVRRHMTVSRLDALIRKSTSEQFNQAQTDWMVVLGHLSSILEAVGEEPTPDERFGFASKMAPMCILGILSLRATGLGSKVDEAKEVMSPLPALLRTQPTQVERYFEQPVERLGKRLLTKREWERY